MRISNIQNKFTFSLFNDPGSPGSPTSTVSNVLDWDIFIICETDERSSLSFISGWDSSVFPSYPETTEILISQNSRSWNFSNVWFRPKTPIGINIGVEKGFFWWLPVFTDHGFAVTPSSNENFVHGSRFACAWAERYVGVIWGSYPELADSSAVW